MRQIELRVRNKEANTVVGYEYFNTPLNDGFCFVDLSELKPGQTIDDLTLHSNYSHPPMLSVKNMLDQLVREEYSGFKDSTRNEEFPDGKKIYENDVLQLRNKELIYRVVFEDGAFVLYHQYSKWGNLSRIYDADNKDIAELVEVVGHVSEFEIFNKGK